MPPINKITKAAIDKIKVDKNKTQRLFDGEGLYLETSKTGGMHWYLKYRVDGKEKRLAFGPYPKVGLEEVREERDKAKKLLRDSLDPGDEKKKEQAERTAPTFYDIATEYVENQRSVWATSHTRTVEGRLKLDVYPAFGNQRIAEITPQDILAMLRKIEDRRAFETASRVLGFCSLIFKYAVTLSLINADPCRDLRPALKPYIKRQLAAITKPDEVGGLMLSIDDYKGGIIVRSALLFSALTFCRPGEIRHAEWDEIDWDEKMWTIPAEKMKGRIEHKVPLSIQAIEVLQEIRPYTGNVKYIFPSPRTTHRPLSENGVLSALRNMGYTKEQMTAHGFRSMASTLLNENNMGRFDVIEAQLAHKGAD